MSAAPIIIPLTLHSNPDGSLRTTNPAGDFNPAPPALTVDKTAFANALGSWVGLQTGAPAIAQNLRGAWLTGTEAATCTFQVRTVSGSNVASKNWSVTGATLNQSLVAGSIGSGVIEVDAVDSGGHVLSLGQFSWSIAAPPGTTDVLAPTVPLRVAATASVGSIAVTMDPSADDWENAIAPSGMDHYNVYVDGAGSPSQAVAAVKNPALQLTLSNIGAIASPGAPTAVQAAGTGDWTLTAAGIGFHNNTAEECLFVGAPLTGDFVATVKVDAFTSANAFSPAGLMIRETLAQGAIFAAVYFQPSALGVQVKRRPTTGSVGQNVASAATASGYVRLTRSGTNVIASYSADGVSFSDLATMPLPMASQVYIGMVAASQTAGTNFTAVLHELNINTAPQVSFNVTAATGAHSIRVSAVDIHGNESAQSPALTVTVPASSGGGGGGSSGIRVFPGVYQYLDFNTSNDSQISRMQHFKNKPGYVGFQIFKFWASLENPNVKGDYTGNWASAGTAGFQLIDKFLNGLPAGMKLMVHVETYGFAGASGSQSPVFPKSFAPAYLGGSDYGPDTASTDGIVGGAWVNSYASGINVKCFVRWWVAAVMDRIIAMGQAYGARYKDDTRLVMWSQLGESAVNQVGGYNDAAGNAQMANAGRYFDSLRAAWPNTELRFWGNYLSDTTLFNTVNDAAHGRNLFCGGGPDCVNETPLPARIIPYNRAFRGLNPKTGVADSKYHNYTGEVSYVSEFEGDEMNPRSGKQGPATFGDNNWTDYINNGGNLQGTNYVTVWDNTFAGNNDKRSGGYLTVGQTYNGSVYNGPAFPPDAPDWFGSLATGAPVDGADAGTTLPYLNIRPSKY